MAGSTKTFYSVEDYNLVAHFERLREQLLEEKCDDRLDRPLAFWALASDRRLPFAFLGRTLRDLLNTPFDELLATPGVGHKKIASLITLLVRATKDPPPGEGDHLDASSEPALNGAGSEGDSAEPGTFNPMMVSELMWTRWRDTVRRHGLESIRLGQLAPTLRALPTVIWHRQLGEYTDLTLADIRQLKTHGEKRVRAIMEIFWGVHEALSSARVHDHLHFQLVPRFVREVEDWVLGSFAGPEGVTVPALREGLAKPILDQIQVDTSRTVWKIAAERVGLNGRSLSVKQQSQRMGVTRARVYQLLEDCGKVMEVRWPEGQALFSAFGRTLEIADCDAQVLRFYERLMGLLFPGNAAPDHASSTARTGSAAAAAAHRTARTSGIQQNRHGRPQTRDSAGHRGGIVRRYDIPK